MPELQCAAPSLAVREEGEEKERRREKGRKKERKKRGLQKKRRRKGERKAIAWTVSVSIFFFYSSSTGGHFSAEGDSSSQWGVGNQPPHNMAVRTAPLSHTEKQKWS